METALYYPDATIQSKGLLKNSLLLWDNVECIIPTSRGFTRPTIKSKQYEEAYELLVSEHSPTSDEQRRAHIAVKRLLRESPPQSFILDAMRHSDPFLIFPEKFSMNTWELLGRSGLAEIDEGSADYAVPPAFGLLMISILADECAGSQKQKVTDRTKAYAWVTEHYANKLGGEFVKGLDASDVGLNYKRLVTISLEVLGADQIPLKNLLAMRKREARGSSGDYRAIRQRYREQLKAFVDRITREARTAGDVKEIQRQFKADMKQDLINLKRELNLASIKSLFSKEMALAAVAFAGAFAEPIAGLTTLATTLKGIGVAPLIKTGSEYRAARRKALRESAMSWLYMTKQKPIAFR